MMKALGFYLFHLFHNFRRAGGGGGDWGGGGLDSRTVENGGWAEGGGAEGSWTERRRGEETERGDRGRRREGLVGR